MKTARTILPLLLLSIALLAPKHTLRAQTGRDAVIVTPVGNSNLLWQFRFDHFGPSLTAVNRLVLWIDTVAYPNFRFAAADVQPGSRAASQNWVSCSDGSISQNLDSAYWIDASYFIPHGDSDQYFEFQLQPVTPFVNIYDSTVVINWSAGNATANTCTPISTISNGSFELIPTSFQGFLTDTLTAISSTPLCDPVFNFTVHDQNAFRSPIGSVRIQLLDPNLGTMRPSGISAPAGWKLDSVSTYSAYFTGEPIGSLASQNNFMVSLLASPAATSFPFVLWAHDNFGAFIDRDTVLSISATPASCSLDPSQDTLRVTNNRGCAFNFNLENSHTGEANLTVSTINKLVLHITTPGLTWSSPTPPTPNLCWSYIGPGTQTLSFQTASANCAQPSGLTWAYGAAIDGSTPGELITVQWSDSTGSTGISSGTVTFKCVPPPTPDSVFVEAAGDCCYRVRVKNAHQPTPTNIKSVLFEMPPSNGVFSPNGLSSSAGWAASPPSNGAVQFTASNGNGLVPGATDTFYFCIEPKLPNTSWPLTFIDYEAKTNNTITDTTIKNIAGCTPPVVLDSVMHRMNMADCFDTIKIINRGNSPIDSIEVIPASGVSVATAKIAVPWSTPVITGGNATLFGGTIQPEAPLTFIVSYTGEASGTPFNVDVRTLHTAAPASSVDSMLSCAVSGVVSSQSAIAPLTLTIAPNPLRDRTDITLTIGTPTRVQMVLLNVLGQSVQNVANEMVSAGEHNFTLDATALPTGTYYLRLETNGEVVTKKLVIEK